AFTGSRMRIEDNASPGGDNINDIPAQRRDRMRRWRDCADHPEGRVLFECNPVIAAAAIRMQPLDSGHQLNNFQLFNLMVEPANLRFFEFQASPLRGVGVANRLDEVDDFGASGDALLLKLQISSARRVTSLIGVLE